MLNGPNIKSELLSIIGSLQVKMLKVAPLISLDLNWEQATVILISLHCLTNIEDFMGPMKNSQLLHLSTVSSAI